MPMSSMRDTERADKPHTAALYLSYRVSLRCAARTAKIRTLMGKDAELEQLFEHGWEDVFNATGSVSRDQS